MPTIDPFHAFDRKGVEKMAEQLRAGYVDAYGNWHKEQRNLSWVKVADVQIRETPQHFELRMLLADERELLGFPITKVQS